MEDKERIEGPDEDVEAQRKRKLGTRATEEPEEQGEEETDDVEGHALRMRHTQ